MRFRLNNGEESEYFEDTNTGRSYWFGEHEDFCELCELLNDLSEETVKEEAPISNGNDLINQMQSMLSDYENDISKIQKSVDSGKANVAVLTAYAVLCAKCDVLREYGSSAVSPLN